MDRFKYIFLIMLAAMVIMSSCSSEEEIDIGPFVYEPAHLDTTSVLGKKIYEIKKKYNTDVIYNWDTGYIGSGANATPPYYEKVYDFILFMEDVWFKPYNDETFLRDNLPREIVLIGGYVNYGEDNGSSFGAAGLAESLYRVSIGGVNSYRTDFTEAEAKDYRYDLHKVLHHEFAHILNRRYDLPKGYEDISKGLYLKNTHFSSLDPKIAAYRGFVRPYGATNEMEDFATLIEVIVTRSEETIRKSLFWELIIKDYKPGDLLEFKPLPLSDFELIEKKYNLAIEFYNNLGIDIQAIGNAYEASINAANEASEKGASPSQMILLQN